MNKNETELYQEVLRGVSTNRKNMWTKEKICGRGALFLFISYIFSVIAGCVIKIVACYCYVNKSHSLYT